MRSTASSPSLYSRFKNWLWLEPENINLHKLVGVDQRFVVFYTQSFSWWHHFISSLLWYSTLALIFHVFFLIYSFIKKNQFLKFTISTHTTLKLDTWDEGCIPTRMFNNKANELSCVLAPYLTWMGINQQNVRRSMKSDHHTWRCVPYHVLSFGFLHWYMQALIIHGLYAHDPKCE